MIYTITLTPCIEKRVHGINKNDVLFEGESFAYNSGGIGIKLSKYLKYYQIESSAAFISGKTGVKFISQDLKERGIDYVYIETNADTPYQVITINELEERQDLDTQRQNVSENELKIFQSVLCGKMLNNSVSVLEYNDCAFPLSTFESFYQALSDKSEVLICDLHPQYYPMLKKRNANVLLMEEKQIATYLRKEKNPLSDVIEVITKEFSNLAKIIVYAISSNDFLLFMENEIYRVVCSVKSSSKTIYKEALLCGIIKCYEEDGDMETLSRECISMSVGAALSDGLYVSNKKVLEELQSKITVYRL